jgi:hypothetical protein
MSGTVGNEREEEREELRSTEEAGEVADEDLAEVTGGTSYSVTVENQSEEGSQIGVFKKPGA